MSSLAGPATLEPSAEQTLIDLCREAGRADESLLVHLLPYLPFRTAKQQLPIESMYAPVWHRKTAADVPRDLDAAFAAWDDAIRRSDGRATRRSQLLVAALQRIDELL